MRNNIIYSLAEVNKFIGQYDPKTGVNVEGSLTARDFKRVGSKVVAQTTEYIIINRENNNGYLIKYNRKNA